MFRIDKSPIHGKGIFATRPIERGTIIGATLERENGQLYQTVLSRFLNHSDYPNAANTRKGNHFELFALRNIKQNEEIVTNYSHFAQIVAPEQVPPMESFKRSNPRIRVIKKIGSFIIVEVEGSIIRKDFDPNFTNFGYHLDFPFIPPNEFWIDKNSHPDETMFFIHHMLVENRLRASGISRTKAIEIADKAERSERSKLMKYKEINGELPENIKIKHMGTTPSGKKIWIVNGKAIRDKFNVEFTEGGHWLVYKWIPKDEIFIDDDIQPQERVYILFHELLEAKFMADGKNYEEAHALATKAEWMCRQKIKTAAQKPSWERYREPLWFLPVQKNPPPGFIKKFDLPKDESVKNIKGFQWIDVGEYETPGIFTLDDALATFLLDQINKHGWDSKEFLWGRRPDHGPYIGTFSFYLTDPNGRQVRLGKFLLLLQKEYKKKEENALQQKNALELRITHHVLQMLKAIFHQYELQPKNNKWRLIVSAEPSDLRAISTEKGWASCVTIYDPKEKKECLESSIAARDIIAYAVDEKGQWLARSVLRFDGKGGWWPDRVYGQPSSLSFDHFKSVVSDWLKQKGILGKEGEFTPFFGGYSDWLVEQGQLSPQEKMKLEEKEVKEKEIEEPRIPYKGTGRDIGKPELLKTWPREFKVFVSPDQVTTSDEEFKEDLNEFAHKFENKFHGIVKFIGVDTIDMSMILEIKNPYPIKLINNHPLVVEIRDIGPVKKASFLPLSKRANFKIKALSIKQPWANMIANGEKTIETRKWETMYRGPLLIVSTSKPNIEPAGYALAVANLVDCHPMTKTDERAAKCETYPSAYAWILENINKIKPFPVKGSLGLYEVELPEQTSIDFPFSKRAKDHSYVGKKEEKSGNVTYLYDEKHIKERNRKKEKRLQKLSKLLKKVRDTVKKDLTSDDEKTRLAALAVALIDETYERIGNEESARELKHFGVTGWLLKHVTFGKNKATIKYVGKAGVKQTKEIKNKAVLAALKEACKDKKKNDRILEGIGPKSVNAYLAPFKITAKDIRGFHANKEMLRSLKENGKGKLPKDEKEREKELKNRFKNALEDAAKKVGHEPGTLKRQYLMPRIEQYYMEGKGVQKLLATQKIPFSKRAAGSLKPPLRVVQDIYDFILPLYAAAVAAWYQTPPSQKELEAMKEQNYENIQFLENKYRDLETMDPKEILPIETKKWWEFSRGHLSHMDPYIIELDEKNGWRLEMKQKNKSPHFKMTNTDFNEKWLYKGLKKMIETAIDRFESANDSLRLIERLNYDRRLHQIVKADASKEIELPYKETKEFTFPQTNEKYFVSIILDPHQDELRGCLKNVKPPHLIFIFGKDYIPISSQKGYLNLKEEIIDSIEHEAVHLLQRLHAHRKGLPEEKVGLPPVKVRGPKIDFSKHSLIESEFYPNLTEIQKSLRKALLDVPLHKRWPLFEEMVALKGHDIHAYHQIWPLIVLRENAPNKWRLAMKILLPQIIDLLPSRQLTGTKIKPFISFPFQEQAKLKKQLENGQPIYTTRILKERGKYHQGQELITPWQQTVVVTRVKQLQGVENHPCISELTDEERSMIGGHKFDFIELEAIPFSKRAAQEQKLVTIDQVKKAKVVLKFAETAEEKEITFLFQLLAEALREAGGFEKLEPWLKSRFEDIVNALWKGNLPYAKKLVDRFLTYVQPPISKRESWDDRLLLSKRAAIVTPSLEGVPIAELFPSPRAWKVDRRMRANGLAIAYSIHLGHGTGRLYHRPFIDGDAHVWIKDPQNPHAFGFLRFYLSCGNPNSILPQEEMLKVGYKPRFYIKDVAFYSKEIEGKSLEDLYNLWYEEIGFIDNLNLVGLFRKAKKEEEIHLSWDDRPPHFKRVDPAASIPIVLGAPPG